MIDTAEHYVVNVPEALERKLLESLKSRRLQAVNETYSTHVLPSDDPAAMLARSLECKVFAEFSFDQPIEEVMRKQYVKYDDHSFFIVVVNWSSMRVVGVMRIVYSEDHHPGLAALRRLKSLVDLENPAEPWQLSLNQVLVDSRLGSMRGDNTWDVATLAVHPDYRRKAGVTSAISFSLYHQLYQLSVKNKIEYWVAILDVAVLDLIQQLGQPFHHFAGVGTKFYVGGDSTPVYCHIGRAAKRLKWRDYLLYRQLAGGYKLRRSVYFEEPIIL